MNDVYNPFGHKSFGSPFYGGSQIQKMFHAKPKPVELLPFQAEDVATNQQSIPLPYLGGTQVIAVRWIGPAIDQITHQTKSTGKKG